MPGFSAKVQFFFVISPYSRRLTYTIQVSFKEVLAAWLWQVRSAATLQPAALSGWLTSAKATPSLGWPAAGAPRLHASRPGAMALGGLHHSQTPPLPSSVSSPFLWCTVVARKYLVLQTVQNLSEENSALDRHFCGGVPWNSKSVADYLLFLASIEDSCLKQLLCRLLNGDFF